MSVARFVVRKITMIAIKRDKKGRFAESSSLSKKVLSVRLTLEDRQKLDSICDDRGTTPTELARIILAQWIEENAA